MPQLVFKGLKPQDVCQLSLVLPQKLAALSHTPVEYFTLECLGSTYYSAGQPQPPFPMVEVKQFRREPQVQQAMANCIGEHVKQLGYETCDVYFILLAHEDYFEFS